MVAYHRTNGFNTHDTDSLSFVIKRQAMFAREASFDSNAVTFPHALHLIGEPVMEAISPDATLHQALCLIAFVPQGIYKPILHISLLSPKNDEGHSINYSFVASAVGLSDGFFKNGSM